MVTVSSKAANERKRLLSNGARFFCFFFFLQLLFAYLGTIEQH